jgi:hypothetical protein
VPVAHAAGSGYKIVRNTYALPADFGRPLDSIVYPQNRTPVQLKSRRDMTAILAEEGEFIVTGDPRYALIGWHGTLENATITFDRVPTVAYDVVVPYQRMLQDLLIDSDVPLFPTAFHSLLVWGAAARYLTDHLEDSGGAVFEQRFQRGLAAMVASHASDADESVQMEVDMAAYDAQTGAVLGVKQLIALYDPS